MKKKILTIMLTVAVMLAFSVPVTAGSAEAKTAAGTAQTATAALQTAGTSARTTTTVPKLRITFVDVGAGDCTYIELPGGADILIDAGLSGKGESVVSKLDSLEPGMLSALIVAAAYSSTVCPMPFSLASSIALLAVTRSRRARPVASYMVISSFDFLPLTFPSRT